MLNVVCVSWGTKYPKKYVNILYDMVWRQLKTKFRFICYTDDPQGFRKEVKTRKLPEGLEGWYNKLWLFSKEAKLKGRVLYFDLDTIITGRLEDIAAYDGDFCLLEDFTGWTQYASGVMAWKPEKVSYIWDEYKKAGYPQCEKGDQEFICRHVNNPDTWQSLYPNSFVSYRLQAASWPPNGTKVVCFHGKPDPHECDGWVELIWKEGGAGEAELVSVCNTEIETIKSHIKTNMARGLTVARRLYTTRNKDMLLVGGGPTMKKTLGHIRLHKARGGHLWTMNNTHDWLIERGIIPDFHLMLDARQENVRFVQNPHKDVTYFVASQCHPDVFEALKDNTVIIWHSYQPEFEKTLIESTEPGQEVWMLGGGGTVGLKALYLGAGLGYRKFRLFGYDSSYAGNEHHSYNQPENDGEKRLLVHAVDQTFSCAPWMLRQAQDFQEQARTLTREGAQLIVYGGGLIPFIAQQIGVAQHG